MDLQLLPHTDWMCGPGENSQITTVLCTHTHKHTQKTNINVLSNLVDCRHFYAYLTWALCWWVWIWCCEVNQILRFQVCGSELLATCQNPSLKSSSGRSLKGWNEASDLFVSFMGALGMSDVHRGCDKSAKILLAHLIQGAGECLFCCIWLHYYPDESDKIKAFWRPSNTSVTCYMLSD